MKPSLLLIVSLFAAPALALAQTNPETEKAVTKLEQDMSAALTKADAAAVEGMVADNFHLVNPDGTIQTKAQFVADLKSGAFKLTQNNLSEVKVQAADADMAVVTYRSEDKGTYKGEDISGQYRWTDVLVKRDGKWQFVVGQGTRIAEQKP